FRPRLRELAEVASRLKMAKQALEQYARRYAGVAEMAARIPVADAERQREEQAADAARAAAAKARGAADQHRVEAVTLRSAAEGRRSEKSTYTETDGGPGDCIATVEDLRDQYKTLERTLASKRDAQQATVSLELGRVKSALFKLNEDYAPARRDVAEADMA